MLRFLFIVLWAPEWEKPRAIMLSDGRCARVFLSPFLEIQLCGNSSDEMSVNGLWKLCLDYADMHFFPLTSPEQNSDANSLCVYLESCPVAASFFSVLLILLLPHKHHYSYYQLATTLKGELSREPAFGNWSSGHLCLWKVRNWLCYSNDLELVQKQYWNIRIHCAWNTHWKGCRAIEQMVPATEVVFLARIRNYICLKLLFSLHTTNPHTLLSHP